MKSMDRNLVHITPAKRLAYTFVGLLAGDVMLLFFLLRHALHATLFAGEPVLRVGDALQLFVLYAGFSILGWVLIGLPTALIFPAGFITRLSWPFALIVINLEEKELAARFGPSYETYRERVPAFLPFRTHTERKN